LLDFRLEIDVKRREFIAVLGGAVIARPLVAFAQPSQAVMIGFLGTRGASDDPQLLTAFRRGLAEIGYIEGQNLAIEYRWADSHYDRLPALAADLVKNKVAVIVANGAASQIAKKATATIPIVFVVGSDPVETGLVESLNKPGGNVTGVSILDVQLGPKRLELLHKLNPTKTGVAVLVNPDAPARAQIIIKDLKAAAQILGLELHVLNASTDRDLDAAFGKAKQLGAGGLIIGGESFFNSRSKELGALSVRYSVPTIYQFRAFTSAGGLVSYGTSLTEAYRLVGVYTGRILKGEKPVDLPVQLATKVEMIINLKTANALGLAVPPTLLATADEVIE
jgi:putative ABC transport system substrate-binding protein